MNRFKLEENIFNSLHSTLNLLVSGNKRMFRLKHFSLFAVAILLVITCYLLWMNLFSFNRYTKGELKEVLTLVDAIGSIITGIAQGK